MSDVKLSEIIAPVFKPVHGAVRAREYTHYWLKGGRGSGKSSYISIEIPLGIMRDPNANAVVYRKVANTLADSVVAQRLWGIGALGVAEYWQLRKSPYELIYKPTGQRIMFKGADNPEKSKGLKLASGYFAFVWFEELTEFAGMDEVETILRSLMRGEGMMRVFYSYNPPKSMQNWVNAEALICKPSRLVHHSSYLDLPPAWLGEQFIAEAEETRRVNELKYRWAYMGEITGTGGAVFDNVATREITDAELQSFDKVYPGLDFGYTIDPTAYVVIHYDAANRRVFVLDEYYAVKASFDRIAEEIFKRPPAWRKSITADRAEPRSIDELRSRGLQIYAAKKGPGSVEHGLKWLQDLREIVVDPARTPNTARELLGYEYETDGNGGFKAAYPDRDNHAIDAMRYALESVIGFKRIGTVRGMKA